MTPMDVTCCRWGLLSQVPMQDMIDSYMAPFQACVEKGEVSSAGRLRSGLSLLRTTRCLARSCDTRRARRGLGLTAEI